MKKYLLLTLHYCYYISALVFLPPNIATFTASFLVSILALDNIYFTILPIVLCFFLPVKYVYILSANFFVQIILYFFIKKNRFYALGSYLLNTLIVFFVLFIIDGFNIENLEIMLLLLVVYSVMNALYVYQNVDGKKCIIPYNQKLLDLTLILGYFFILFLFSNNPYLMYFLFMQLFLIHDYKYNIIFGLVYALIQAIKDYTKIAIILYPLAISFIPISIAACLDYTNILWVGLLLYSIIINLVNLKEKRLSIENDYINVLFDDFNQYLNNLNKEYDKNIKIKELKETKLKEISNEFCFSCNKNTLCKHKLAKRYSFLAGAMLGMNQNIYDCPYYNKFNIYLNVDNVNKAYEYSAIKSLGFELSYLYNQSLALKTNYERFIWLLGDYGYEVSDLDINLASRSLYFSIKINNKKPIINELFLRCAYKAFGEELEIKTVDDKIYFFKKPSLKITYAHTILAKGENLMSGDNYYVKKDYNHSYIFALSDGMGSGYNAYTESAEALKTVSQLSSYHFRIQTILRLLEDIYELRSNYDRYATLDFLSIDTANQKMNLYKMGSSTTYILHNNHLMTYENKALPLKLDDVNSHYELDIYSGDYIFLLSDGIGDFITTNEFYNLVKDKDTSADEVCNTIINYLKQKENNNLKDDLSLIVIKAI